MYSTALIRAAYFNQAQRAMLLIQSDECNVGAVAYNGWSALYGAACYNNNIELARLLLQKDASNIDAQLMYDDKCTALITACCNGNAAMIELLIRSGANFDIKNSQNRTAFHYLDKRGGHLSQEEKTRLKDLPKLIKQEQAQS